MAIENLKKHLISSGDIYIYIYIISKEKGLL